MIAELLAGALTGGGTYHAGTAVTRVIHNNMLSIILDPDRLGGAGSWRDDVARFIDWIKASPPAPGVDGVLVAGEPERRMRAERRRSGIPIDPTTWAELGEAASAVGVPAALLEAARVR